MGLGGLRASGLGKVIEIMLQNQEHQKSLTDLSSTEIFKMSEDWMLDEDFWVESARDQCGKSSNHKRIRGSSNTYELRK